MDKYTPSEIRYYFARAVRFAKKADCLDFATISSICRFLEAKPAEVMSYIEDNPRLLKCAEGFKGKKSCGLCVFEAYETPEQNPWNDEWLQRKIETEQKTIYISEVNNYGEILGHCVIEDRRPMDMYDGRKYLDNRKNTWLWRNTAEKVKYLEENGYIRKHDYCMGGYGDSYVRKEFEINANDIKVLEAAGWTVTNK